MFTVGPVIRPGNVDYLLLDSPLERYLTNEGEPWFHGRGADALGITDNPTDPEAILRNLLLGYGPAQEGLRQNAGRTNPYVIDGKKHWPRAADHFVVSPEKDTDVLWATLPRRDRDRFEEAARRALRTTLELADAQFCKSRRGRGGSRGAEQAKAVFAVVEHGSTRPVDGLPQPKFHFHIAWIAAARREDGTWGSTHPVPMYRAQRLLGALFRAEHASILQREYGLRIEAKPVGFRLVDVPKKLAKLWSGRHDQITDALGGREATQRASNIAALRTRSDKDGSLSGAELFAAWRSQAAEYGFSVRHALSLLSRGHYRSHALDLPEVKARLTEATLSSLTAEHSHFTAHDYLRRISELAPGTGLGVSELAELTLDTLSSAPDIVRLEDAGGQTRYTSRELWELEAELLKMAEELARRPTPTVSSRHVAKAALKHDLSDEQRAALFHITGPRAISAVTGRAGSGKTRSFVALREVAKAHGLIPVCATVSNKAARVFERQTGIAASSITSLLYNANRDPTKKSRRQILRAHLKYILGRVSAEERDATITPRPRILDVAAVATGHISQSEFRYREAIRAHGRRYRLTPKHVLILDEVSMNDTRQMLELFALVKESGARLILSGDHQLQSIGAGAPYGRLFDLLKPAVIRTIRRQRDPADRRAVRLAARGESAALLKDYQARGRLHVAASRAAARRDLITHWTEAGGIRHPASHLILAAYNDDVRKLNELAQEARRPQLGKPYVSVDDYRIHTGDRVVCTKNAKRLGLLNNYFATVVSISPLRRALTLRLDDTGKRVRVSLRTYDALSLGYAATVHRAQGETVDNAHVLVSGRMTHREWAYVALSRARQTTHIFTDEFEAPGLEKQLSQSRRKLLAHEVGRDRDEHHRQRHAEHERSA